MDNPFVIGGPMQHIGPHDGMVYPENHSWDTAGALVDMQVEMVTGRSVPVWNNHTVGSTGAEQLSGVIGGGKAVRPSNYKGRRFDPNY